MHFQSNCLLKKFSTLRIGGLARWLVEVDTIERLQEVLSYSLVEKIPYIVIGKGSNSLFDDRGFDGLVIVNKIAFCTFDQTTVFVGAGYSFALLGVQTARRNLSGLEFAAGIPGTVGGAVYMNAGAGGAEVSQVLDEVLFITEQGEKQQLLKNEMVFDYRYSSFQEKKGAIAAATFRLASSLEARKKQLSLINYRTRTQPYGDLSCGCIFRNPAGNSAGQLIEQAGLKGMRIGGAEVSSLHANFIVNTDNAKANDVLVLAKQVQEIVRKKTGIALEMELRVIPYAISS